VIEDDQWALPARKESTSRRARAIEIVLQDDHGIGASILDCLKRVGQRLSPIRAAPMVLHSAP